MAAHKTFHGVTSERKQRRMHRRADGSTKIPLRYAAAKKEAARLTTLNGVVAAAYKCPVCGWFHVGNVSSGKRYQHANRIDQVVILESGERVANAIKLENGGSRQKRIAYFAKMAATVRKKQMRGY